MTENPTQITEFLDGIFRYGAFWVYTVIFIACFIENLFPPFPGDSFIAAAGGLVALQRLDFLLTIGLILTAGVSSVMVLYYVGSAFGRDYFEKKNFKYFSTYDIDLMEKKLSKWGAPIIVASRFLVGIRSALAVAAGVARFPAKQMFFYSVASYTLFTFLLMYLAIGAVENLELLKSYFIKYNLIIWPLMTLLIASYFVKKFLSFKKVNK